MISWSEAKARHALRSFFHTSTLKSRSNDEQINLFCRMASVRQRSHGNETNGIDEAGTNKAKTVEEEKPKYWDPLVDGVKWIERYAEPLEKFFERLPDFISTFVATFAVFTFGATLRGMWPNCRFNLSLGIFGFIDFYTMKFVKLKECRCCYNVFHVQLVYFDEKHITKYTTQTYEGS